MTFSYLLRQKKNAVETALKLSDEHMAHIKHEFTQEKMRINYHLHPKKVASLNATQHIQRSARTTNETVPIQVW